MIRPSLKPVVIPGSLVRAVLAAGALDRVGDYAREMEARRILLVSDPGLREPGYTERAARSLLDAGLAVAVWDAVIINPTDESVVAALPRAREHAPDMIVGLGGGSAMDTAKGINFLLTNGGAMADYWGVGKATKSMLPMIAIPTTAGTGSEAQRYALICNAKTHVKMACGDEKARPRLAILDPDLTASVPPKVAAMAGIDAVAHAVETAGCNRRSPASCVFSREAWGLLSAAFEKALRNPQDAAARQDMLLGAHLAGCAIENSMLGAAHAAANPLTARYGIPHGQAVGVMLPHVVRFNSAADALVGGTSSRAATPSAGEGTGGTCANPYADLDADGPRLAERLGSLLHASGLATSLSQLDVPPGDLPQLAKDAARQWTANFNPRPVTEADFSLLYVHAMEDIMSHLNGAVSRA